MPLTTGLTDVAPKAQVGDKLLTVHLDHQLDRFRAIINITSVSVEEGVGKQVKLTKEDPS